jgi:hypothetical protein
MWRQTEFIMVKISYFLQNFTNVATERIWLDTTELEQTMSIYYFNSLGLLILGIFCSFSNVYF